MSEELNENLNVEELSAEDRKKAINLQDLVYVKKYIDDRHYDKYETDQKIETEMNTFKEEINEDINTAIEASNKSYTKEESDELYLKKTDEIPNANKAKYILDSNDETYLSIQVMTPEEYESSGKSSGVLYFIRES